MTKQRYTPAYPAKFNTEIIQLLGPCKSVGQVEWETPETGRQAIFETNLPRGGRS